MTVRLKGGGPHSTLMFSLPKGMPAASWDIIPSQGLSRVSHPQPVIGDAAVLSTPLQLEALDLEPRMSSRRSSSRHVLPGGGGWVAQLVAREAGEMVQGAKR